MRLRLRAFAITLAALAVTLASLALQGLNLGLDFTGGVLIEARSDAPVDLETLRGHLDGLRLGSVSLQTVDDARTLLIRLPEQEGGAAAQRRALDAVEQVLGKGFEVRRTEIVGPQISRELLRDGVMAAALAVLLIAVYVWFRFEWQFGLSALLTTLHDVLLTFGLFSLLRLEFDMTVVAALLTIAGYSINDTVVVFDRIRENLRRYKSLPLAELIDLSVNQTLSRTLLTSGTTLVAVLALLLFGGPVLRNFSLAMVWGIVVGTLSSIFVASALLLQLPSVWRLDQTEDPGASRTGHRTPTMT